MTFQERAAQIRANTRNTDATNVSNNDVYNELILTALESLANALYDSTTPSILNGFGSSSGDLGVVVDLSNNLAQNVVIYDPLSGYTAAVNDNYELKTVQST